MTRVRCPNGASIEERLRLRMVEAPSGCWVWLGALDRESYGLYFAAGRTRPAHRISYETFIGPIPEGLQIDHLCRYHRCINPRHLQPVTARVNMLRGTSPVGRGARTNKCKNGHDLLQHSYLMPSTGTRRCRICHRDRRHRYDAERRVRAVSA